MAKAKNTYGQEVEVSDLGGIESGEGAERPEDMESHPTEVSFYSDLATKFEEMAQLIRRHGEWHRSLGE